ncbi:MAG: cysteine hydrolase [SAR202 cluster bacterium]|jgi:nicotinamidase-related amidase|nr:MAG: cysteine hydrolase [SAR202 cluster bacterium]MQG80970.1 cysteine hydrolase [SAR202 cluster bacterium]GIS83375.1 MAG: isochorismatase [Dehalococcoidia bacterium]|tara:strand:+ start:1862 stop:2446 length:585 start_codon:yes stop_codon:yes gene_type:complete
MTDGRINISSTALIIADFYKDMMGTIPHSIERNVLDNTQKLQKAARQSGMLICYSATVFRPGYIEISDRNKTFSQRKNSGQPAVSDPIEVIHPGVSPIDGEVVVGKHRVNALYGTDLDMTLRANQINTIIILGYATSGVVLSTTRFAADSDYSIIIVEDCCADTDPEVHNFLMEKIFPRQADVVTSVDMIKALS